MASATTKPNPSMEPQPFANRIVPVNSAPPDFDAARDLPAGFLEFLAPLHAALTLRQRALVARRDFALAEAHAGKLPDYLPPSVATTNSWRIELPAWCADQRNQMTGPADDADLVVKMLNSGAPGVMLDLEDSTANSWEHNSRGIKNILEGLAGKCHQVHGAGGIASARVSDGRVCLEFARSHPGAEPRALGLHGQLDSLQSGKSGVGAPRPQHHSAQRGVLPEFAQSHAGNLPQTRNARHRRNDRTVSEPRRCGAECAGAKNPC